MKAPRFVVYHAGSTVEKRSFYFKHHALAFAAKLNKAFGGYAVATLEHYYKNVVKTVTRVNMMSGKEYTEASNTPSYCSPASEAYWSM